MCGCGAVLCHSQRLCQLRTVYKQIITSSHITKRSMYHCRSAFLQLVSFFCLSFHVLCALQCRQTIDQLVCQWAYCRASAFHFPFIFNSIDQQFFIYSLILIKGIKHRIGEAATIENYLFCWFFFHFYFLYIYSFKMASNLCGMLPIQINLKIGISRMSTHSTPTATHHNFVV